MVGGADERSGFDNAETDREAEFFPFAEFFRRDPAVDGEVLRSRLEVLAESEDVDVVFAEFEEGFAEFFLGFADAEHEAGFGDEAAAFRVAEDGDGAIPAGLDADLLLEASNGFDIVIQDVGFGVENDVNVLGVSFEVGDEDFDAGVGVAVADGADGGGPDGGAAVDQFVAGDGGDDAMFEAHFLHGFGDAGRFAEIEFGGAAGLDRAEIAGAGADVAENHHGRGAAGPAFAEIRALGALADRVETVAVNDLPDFAVGGMRGKFCSEPVWLAFNHDEKVSSKSFQNSVASMDFISAGSMVIPSSRFTEVTEPSVMPQGTMPENGSRSLLRLRAKPWQVTHCLTATPMAAILRSPIQMPVLPGRREAARPWQPTALMSVCSRRRR